MLYQLSEPPSQLPALNAALSRRRQPPADELPQLAGGSGQAVDGSENGGVGIAQIRPLGAFGKAALRDDLFQRHPRARDAALHRADGAAADLGRFLVGNAARADEDTRLHLAFRKFQKATLDGGQMRSEEHKSEHK